MARTRLDIIMNVRVTPDLREALEKAAIDDGRTSSNYVRKVLREHLVRRGYLNSPAGQSDRK